MLRLLATLSPGAVLLIGAAGFGVPAAGVAWKAGHWLGYRAGFKAGSAAVVADVEKQNAKAGEVARRIKRTVDECFDAGGEWVQEDGRCDR